MICKNDQKTLAFYSGVALLFIYPLINAGVFYRDDLDRAITGQYGWRGLGRPMADILMRILSASGHYNLDLFPYTMLASCVFLGASSLLLSKHLNRMDVPHTIFVAALLVFNPYILQNIAYRYDSLGMAIAFYLAVLAYTYRDKSIIRERTIKIISGITALTLYQPCANIFIGLLAADIMILGIRNNSSTYDSIKLVIRKAAEFIFFYICYMLFFSTKNNSRAELISPNSEGLKRLSNSIKNLYELVSSYFHGPVYIYFAIPILIALSFSMTKFFHSKKKLLIFITFTIASVFIFSFSLLGPTIFLQEAPVLPRTLISFSVLFVIIAILIVELCPKFRYLALIPIITTFAFSAQLSSALKSQRDYEDFVFSMVARDILNYKNIKSIGTVGQVNINERTKLLIENKPLIGYFLSPATEFLASFQLINKGIPQMSHGYGDEQGNKQNIENIVKENIAPVVSNKDYSIYIKDSLAVVKLGNDNLN
ncbi:glucosyltransferase domain-containing protein [Ewingella americana]|uniref:Glucosyltransferase domain-containing protein n=1 Tax=Ewingella americana TaxID=41202 RepID=A0A502GP22_9GAMM|nr:glucosyltransferase domain-containing protein [Ewingella americana]TPG62736.1 hypothetical protein EAH77_09670 [Ewingella americana]